MLTWQGFQFFNVLGGPDPRPDYTIAGFPEYATDVGQLDAGQRAMLHTIAARIVQSLSTRLPVRAVLVVGHADVALRKPVAERGAFELDVSRRRAASGESALLDQIAAAIGRPSGRYVVKTRAIGVGSAHRVNPHAATEAEMRANRRVQFTFLTESVSAPSCPP